MKQNYPEDTNVIKDVQKKKRRVIAIVAGSLLVVLCVGYLFFAWSRYQKMAKTDAIILAESVESLLHAEHITTLSGSPEDLTKPDYIMTKRGLSQLIHQNDQIRFAYILGIRGADMVFLIDSEDEASDDYSPPGQIYYEATADDMIPFTTGASVLNGPTEDRWGTWYSALIPIEDPVKHTVIAVLGIDYSVAEWNQRILRRLIPDIGIIISLLSIGIALFFTWDQHEKVKARAQKLSIDEALFHSVFDQAPIGISIVHDKNFFYQSEQGNLTMNSMFEKILGRSSAELLTIGWPEITYFEDLQADMEQFDRFSKGETDGYSLEKRFVKPDGSIVWTNMIITSISGSHGKYSMHLCLLEDITARKKVEEEHMESERSKSVLLSHLPGLAYRCKYDPFWTMLFVSDGCAKLTGYPPEALLLNRDLSYNDVIAPEYRDLLAKEWKRILPKREYLKYEYEIITAQNERRWVLELGQGIFDKKGEVEALEGIILDISDRKKSEKTLKYNSEYDVWTGLHNRAFLEDVLKREQHSDFAVKRALIGINLSTMHLLSLTYGFQYSQGLIKRAADTLCALSDDTHRLYYTYENRFTFYVSNYNDKSELSEFCSSIVSVLKSVLAIERIDGGIGIIEIDKTNGKSVDHLLKNLLIASEKALGEIETDFGYSFYDENMESQILREETIRLDLVRVLEGESGAVFYLQFQPIYDMKLGKITGFEALARLKSDRLGSISPIEFIPIAEKTKLIIPLGKEIIKQAIAFISKLSQSGNKTATVSINVSAIQILQPGFMDVLLSLVDDQSIDPKRVSLELTESVFSSRYRDINTVLGLIKEHGIEIAIDDFGTGYSSFARERELNVDYLKIDKSFIDNLVLYKEEEAVTGDIISMAHKLGHRVIAEGVEHEEQVRYLKKYGCDMIQGYLISKPLGADEALTFLGKYHFDGNK